MLGYALLYADLKNDQEIEAVVIMMVCGAAAWVFLLLTLAYRVPLEPDPGVDGEDGDDEEEEV
jgi:hypothetical protein